MADYIYENSFVEGKPTDNNLFKKIYKEYAKKLSALYPREEGESLLEKVNSLKGRSSYQYRKLELIRKLKGAGIDANVHMNEEELMACVQKLPKEHDMEKNMFSMLYKLYKNLETPEKMIEKLVRRLGDEQYKECSVRLAILKQFILNTDYHTGPVKEMIRGKIHAETGELQKRTDRNERLLADWADENLFDVLNYKLSKNEKKKYCLLRTCDDIAKGHFKTNGNTRKALYMFAFAFDMTYYAGTTVLYDPDRDIEKKLFHEYYGNHMLKCINVTDNEKISDFEAEPSGDGINYKNFAEIIYLYYLNRKDKSIRERLSLAEKLIKECEDADAWEKVKSKKEISEEYYTYIYRDYFTEVINGLEENQLKEYIIKHYICHDDKKTKSNILISSETITASYRYRYLLKKRGKEYETGREKDVDRFLELNSVRDEDFKRLIRKLDGFLHPTPRRNAMSIKRSELIAAFYDTCRNENDQEGMSLLELFEDCEMRLNPILIESRFQPLSACNIFDVFMVMMLYRYLNII
ncbi:MAG: hypothetical protein K6G24_03600 [Lachnospiraceae bacterium]|nr:hypothetical protein [Lachnospiraceae bacterium]